ncbi:helix-turn-helix domain-containing protein [Cognatiyoonia sp. IB215182]|nr:helix-turn-helix domain-containing protein [Cognatiyoonia sp. IB215182]MDX8355739.1 helix-turn-helix domain-containing protein [Cognatiyoonia sp. IB215182]
MTDIAVDAIRIKTIRKARRIGRPKLAKLSGLTERQLTKIETSSTFTLDLSVLGLLSEALQVPIPRLTGEFDISEDDLRPASKRACTNGCCG